MAKINLYMLANDEFEFLFLKFLYQHYTVRNTDTIIK